MTSNTCIICEIANLLLFYPFICPCLFRERAHPLGHTDGTFRNELLLLGAWAAYCRSIAATNVHATTSLRLSKVRPLPFAALILITVV